MSKSTERSGPWQVFISHKHDDASLADAIAGFINSRIPRDVEIFLSSNDQFKGPRFGRNLNQQLIKALRQTDALIVVYTSGTNDWSYVMYECGVATDESGDITNTYVFQCMNEVPVVFSDTFRINARKQEDLKRFVRQLFKSTDFFPKQSQMIAPNWVERDVENATDDLANRLTTVLPPLEEQPDRIVPITPYLTVEIPMTVTGEQVGLADDQLNLTKEQIRQTAVVTQHEPGAPRIFGMTAFARTETLQSICRTWMDVSRSSNSEWLDACCDHMAAAALRRDVTPKWSKIRRPNEDQTFVPLVTRMVEVPRAAKMLFDIILAALPDPLDAPVVTEMIKREEFFAQVVKDEEGASINLVRLLSDIESKGKNRIPVLNDAGAVVYIVHRSLIERFLARIVIEKEVGSVSRTDKVASELTLSDMLGDVEIERTMRTTFAVVARSASLGDAGEAMRQIADCRDVFVTENGGRDEPVLGWLTNVDLARAVI